MKAAFHTDQLWFSAPGGIGTYVRDLAAAMMREAQAVAHKLGITFRVPLEKRIAGAEKVGKHKTSMLQDVEAGRKTEIEIFAATVVELGRAHNVPTPINETLLRMVRTLEHGYDGGGTGAP